MPHRRTNSGDNPDRPGFRNVLQPLALATQLGVTMGLMTVITVLAGLLLGSWVDRQLGTRPLATLLFVILSIVAGLLGTVNLAQSTARQLNATAARRVQPRVAFSARDLGRALLLVIELVLVTLVPVGLGLWVGLQLDQAAGTGPVLTIAVAGLALICALLGVYLVTVRAGRRAGGGS